MTSACKKYKIHSPTLLSTNTRESTYIRSGKGKKIHHCHVAGVVQRFQFDIVVVCLLTSKPFGYY